MRKRELHLCIGLLFTCMTAMLLDWPSRVDAQQQGISADDAKEALKNWVGLCAPCHSVQGTGTQYGPPLVGPKARRLTYKQLVTMFTNPEGHSLPEAGPALRRMTLPERKKLAAWLAALKAPEDIVVDSGIPQPPPFIFVQNCAGCHGPDANGGIGPNLHGVSKRRTRDEIVKLIKDPRSAGIKEPMPLFDELSEEERSEIADWLVTLK